MRAASRPFAPDEDIPELWTASKHTTAYIAAMATAAKLYAERRLPSAEERAVLAGYCGWGGRSFRDAASRFPAGFPAPESAASSTNTTRRRTWAARSLASSRRSSTRASAASCAPWRPSPA